MEIASAFRVEGSADEERPGAYAVFPYDRELLRRFREAFPRARWRGEERGWFVPGTTAVQRLNTWMAQELETLDRHADAKGRDACLFEPLESSYLTIGEDLRIRTPYSRTIVEALRAIPWAHWNSDEKVWHVPFRSYEELRHMWPVIEEAARRNEPAEKKKRREEQKKLGSEQASLVQAERRRRRFPAPGDDLPPLETPLATGAWGIVVFEEMDSQTITETLDVNLYPHVKDDPARYVWARWRMPSLWEVYRAKPARETERSIAQEGRGWWWPTRDELREKARQLRQLERAQQSRQGTHKSPSGP